MIVQSALSDFCPASRFLDICEEWCLIVLLQSRSFWIFSPLSEQQLVGMKPTEFKGSCQ